MRLLNIILGTILAFTVSVAPAQADDFQMQNMEATNKVVLVAPDNAWGLRPILRDFAERTGGVAFHRAPGITCSDFPGSAQCIRVHIKNYGYNGPVGPCDGSYFGCANAGGQDPEIWLNSYYYVTNGVGTTQKKEDTACHEFMHTMGLTRHHDHQGCMSNWDERSTATWIEINTLAREYSWLSTNDPSKNY